MRKVLYFFTLFSLLAVTSRAQYTTVNHLSGTQNYAGINVTVTPNGPVSSGPQCGAGPYYIGRIGSTGSGYIYSFSQPITHVKLQFTRLHVLDSVEIRVNNAVFPLRQTDIYPFAGTCGLLTNAVVTPNFLLTTAAPQTTQDGEGAEVIISPRSAPYAINFIEVFEYRKNLSSNGSVYTFQFMDDTCQLPFEVTASDTTPCVGRCVTLNASAYPNTHFSWHSTIATPPLTDADSASRRICGIQNISQGWYIAEATRGICTYRDSVYLTPTLSPPTPSQPISLFPGGACKNYTDTLTFNVQGAAGVDYYWYRKSGAIITGQTTPVVKTTLPQIPIPLIQPSDEDFYCAYVINGDGCYSDTSCYYFDVLPDVTASFNVELEKPTCFGDTIRLRNTSTGADVGFTWIFKDTTAQGAPGSIRNTPPLGPGIPDTIWHGYPLPRPHYTGLRGYEVLLVAKNAGCSDTAKQTIEFNHPLVAYFTTDKDAVCQGYQADTVHFYDSSTAPAGGAHIKVWTFGEFDTLKITNVDSPAYLYTISSLNNPNGVRIAKLVVTDYLGCKDSFEKEIFVDSTGPITFDISDTVICAGQQVAIKGSLNRVGLLGSYWDFGDGSIIKNNSNVVYNYDIPGTYRVSFNADYRVCRDTFAEEFVRVKPFPQLDLGSDTSLCQNGKPILIQPRYASAPLQNLRFRWNTPSKDTLSYIYARHPGVYAATVELDGCTTTDSITIFRNCYLDVPNVFTPNGDGTNDYFLPRQLLSRSVANFKMSIFNRWGQKVFETTSLNGRGWDGNFNGERQPGGVYPYLIEVSFSNKPGDYEEYQGNVTLLR